MKDRVKEKSSMWIFGYGSLVWKPGFAFQSSKIGFIKGYKRRFWHGDDFYRGDKARPARVATLVEDWDARTWGVAYELTDSHAEESLQYLNMREVVLGGYVAQTVEFTPKDGDRAPLLALVYIATASNPIYLGPASDKDIAAQVAVCSGKTGPNVEYVVRLAEFMRLFCPEVDDEHLFSIEAEVLNIFSDSGDIESPKQNSVLLKA